MSSAQTTTNLLDLIRDSGVIPARRLDEYLNRQADLPDKPTVLASRLVKDGMLTTFQAKQLLEGRSKGFRLGPYIVLSPIGSGGMGTVYLAEHSAMGRRVALKVLPKDKAEDRVNLMRFYREARSAAALNHPNIVTAHDVCQEGHIHYIVLDYVQGKNLFEILKFKGRIPWRTAAGYAAQAARGLQHAHEKGLVHRDIKPANLLLDAKGTIKILDMGLARSFQNPNDDITRKLGNGTLIGTADYIAPEQLEDEAEVDIRADIYALGATLFELISGELPFTGTVSTKLVARMREEAPSLRKHRKDVPEAFAAVVAKMMARDRAARYRTPAEVEAALKPFLDAKGNETLAETTLDPVTRSIRDGITTRLTKPLQARRRRRIGLWVAAAVGAVLLVGGGGYAAWSLSQPSIPDYKPIIYKDRPEQGTAPQAQPPVPGS